MVSLASLWLPIVVSAVFAFVASCVIHMALSYHANDLRPLAKEAEIQTALRPFAIPPGDYGLPRAGSMAAMKSPEFADKLAKGPVAFITVVPNGPMAMGGAMAQWFLYQVVVSLFAAYVAAHALATGAHYLAVFRFVGAVAFAGYALALAQNSIWYRRSWATTLRSMFDGLLYALLTGGVFGWLWPR
jgi:hypothetical protein